jgi:hypothetical protein
MGHRQKLYDQPDRGYRGKKNTANVNIDHQYFITLPPSLRTLKRL